MPITIAQAKSLKKGDKVIVTTTRQEWTVEGIRVQGVLCFVDISRGDFKSFIAPERLHLFDAMQGRGKSPFMKTDAPSVAAPEKVQQNLTDALHNTVNMSAKELMGEAIVAPLQETVDKATKELTDADEAIIDKRLEEQFLAEPELTKPARKPAPKKTTKKPAKKAK